MAQPTEFPVNRYYSDVKKALPLGVTGLYSLECSDIYQWNLTATQVIWDGDTPRFKTAEEVYTDSIPNRKQNLKQDCFQYQWHGCTPTIDPNFFSLLTTAQGLKAVNPSLAIPKCDANTAWCDALWAERGAREALIDNMEEYTTDFSSCGNPPYTFDECRLELAGA